MFEGSNIKVLVKEAILSLAHYWYLIAFGPFQVHSFSNL